MEMDLGILLQINDETCGRPLNEGMKNYGQFMSEVIISFIFAYLAKW